MCILDAVLALDLELDLELEADTIGTKIAFLNSDKKHCWGVRILRINRKVKYQIFELSPLELRIVKDKIRCKDSLVISRHSNFKISDKQKSRKTKARLTKISG